MHIADLWNIGWFALQDHDPSKDINFRHTLGACRIHPPLDWENPQPAEQTYGDIVGGLLWEEIAGERQFLHTWWLTGCPAVNVSPPVGAAPAGGVGATRTSSSQGRWVPIRSAGAFPDARLQEKAPGTPPWFTGDWPANHTATVTAGSEEKSQEENLHPDFWGLYAVNAGNKTKAGSLVFDLNPLSDFPDQFRARELQSVFAVRDFGQTPICGLAGLGIALQLGRGGDKDPGLLGYNLWSDYDLGQVGSGAVKAGGPFTLGGGFCQHTLGADADGVSVHPLHLFANALWINDIGDAPLHFDRDRWEKVYGDGPHWVRTYLRINKEAFHQICEPPLAYPQRWEFQTPVFLFVPETGQPPPPPGGGLPPPLEDPPEEELPPGLDKDQPGTVGGKAPLVGEANFKPAYPHSTQLLAGPGLLGKAYSTRKGEADLRGSSVVSEEQRESFVLDAPITAALSAFGLGDGSWSGFTTYNKGHPYQPLMGAGGWAFHSPDVTLAQLFEDFEGSSTSSPARVVLPTGFAYLDLGELDRDLLVKTGARLRGDPLGGVLTALDSGGIEVPTVRYLVGEGGHDFTGNFEADEVTLKAFASSPISISKTGIWRRSSDDALMASVLGTDYVLAPSGSGGGSGDMKRAEFAGVSK